MLLTLCALIPLGKSELYGWTVVSNPIENEATALESVYMVNSNEGWAVGWNGSILRWNGASWQSVSSPVGYDLFSVYMIDSNDGWAVGAGGAIIHWDGNSWNTVPYPPGMKGILRSVYMIDSNNGWAVGGVLSTLQEIIHWDGSSWSLFQSSVGPELTSVFMLDASNGWAVGYDGTIVHWDGSSWNSVASPTNLALWDVFMLSSNDGWAVGTHALMPDYTILRWDGSEWSLAEGPSTIVGSNLESLYFINASDGWAVGSGVIVHWDGSGWSLVDSPLEEGVYRSVFMLGSNEGWAVGSEWIQVSPTTKEQRPRIIHYGTPITVITAVIDIKPDTLNLKSKGKWITAYIELPEGYSVGDIDISTIRLNDTISVGPKAHTKIGDYDNDGIPDLEIKFNRAEVITLLDIGEVTLTITGKVKGTSFKGSDTIKVISK